MPKNVVENLREKVLDFSDQKVLIANLTDSNESKDNYTKLNCNGFGRVRVFKQYSIHMSLEDQVTRKPLFRGHPKTEKLRTQVFQLAGCNWRCWYCFVDYKLLSGNEKFGKFFSADELIDMYLQQPNPPEVIDLSGGNPDIAPEWCLWVMKAIEKRGLKNKVYIWLDDNLGTDILWEALSAEEIRYMSDFPKHSRACCFKGYDQVSFEYNTGERHKSFKSQFEIFERLLKENFNLFAYVTLTGPQGNCTEEKIKTFMDHLQDISSNLPLRVIPLEIRPYSAALARMDTDHFVSIEEQKLAYKFWYNELQKRFTNEEISTPYEAILI